MPMLNLYHINNNNNKNDEGEPSWSTTLVYLPCKPTDKDCEWLIISSWTRTINWPTKETQFVDVTAVLLISFTHISLGLKSDVSLILWCRMLSVSWEHFMQNAVALLWAVKSGTLCRKRKENGSTDIQSFGVNTVQACISNNILCSHT